ncbi:hypothetical protein MJO28_001293 [Puccinia striiformis f. sp. tritici]|uniref:Uncharacterized protein n=1 Tax=Puccinia striiformis f. sp. tritici TaxID=168172 RepID=A0ACC0EUU2_9BASI|nr:hypothetical protein MJO28_001293 [Puccinia striiformis f. sp. tritici]
MNGELQLYGYISLTRAIGTLVGKGEAITGLCERCKQTVEEACIQFGTSAQWYTVCLKCKTSHSAHRGQKPKRQPDTPTLGETLQGGFPSPTLKEGFELVTWLIQYTFLLYDPCHSHVNGNKRSLYNAY